MDALEILETLCKKNKSEGTFPYFSTTLEIDRYLSENKLGTLKEFLDQIRPLCNQKKVIFGETANYIYFNLKEYEHY